MAKNNAKASAAQEPEIDEDEATLSAALAEFEAETAGGEEIVGSSFAPYLKPHLGLILRYTMLYQDASNPEFVRNVCQHNGKEPLMCASGPVASAESVEVAPGDVFSISNYKGIPFDLLGGLSAVSICTELRPMAPIVKPSGGTTPRSPMFIFKTVLSAKDNETFKQRKMDQINMANAARKALAAREAEARVNALPLSPTGTATGAGQAAQQQLRG